MNKLTKIGATALFALFLSACDKAADTQPAPAANTTGPVEALSEAAKADFQKILEWNQLQDKQLAEANAALQQKLVTQDPKQIQEGLTEFNKQVEFMVKSLEAIEVSDAQIKAFKDKTKQVLSLSSEVLVGQVKAMATPNDQAAAQSVQQKSQTLIEAGSELQKLNVELQQRFNAQ